MSECRPSSVVSVSARVVYAPLARRPPRCTARRCAARHDDSEASRRPLAPFAEGMLGLIPNMLPGLKELQSSGRGQMLLKALLIVPLFVRTSATLEIPSLPGYTLVTRPRLQSEGGSALSFIKTREPNFSSALDECHFTFC